MMRTYPHLPLLSLGQCVEVFRDAGVPPGVLASLSGFTRMQIWRWMNGKYARRPHQASLEAVSWLAYKVLRAKHTGFLPDPKEPDQAGAWADAVDDANYPTGKLQDLKAEDLLPQAWLTQTDQPRSDDAAA